jgi:hypothetical protein
MILAEKIVPTQFSVARRVPGGATSATYTSSPAIMPSARGRYDKRCGPLRSTGESGSRA